LKRNSNSTGTHFVKKLSIIALLCLFVVAVNSCRHEIPNVPPGNTTGGNTNNPPGGANTCNPDSVYFENDILPLLTSSCGLPGCHDAATRTEGLNVTTYNGIMNSGKVKAGDIDDSDLIEVIHETDPDDRMPPPPYNPLTADQKAKITKWVQQGARNNKCNSGCDTAQFAYAANVKPIITNRCLGCHSGTFPSAGVSLVNHGDVQTYANSGLLVGTISHAPGYKQMPYGLTKMPDCEITIIRKWVLAGAPNN